MKIPKLVFGKSEHLQAEGGGRRGKGSQPAQPGWQKSGGAPGIVEQKIAITNAGRAGKASPLLLGLGFEHVSSSKNRLLVRKIDGLDLRGRPHLFTEVEISGSELLLRYSVPDEEKAEQRRLDACILLLRILSILPGIKMDAAGASLTVLPALESSLLASEADYATLFAKLRRSQSLENELAARNRKLLRACEEEAARSIERERQIAALSRRLSKLEAVSDQVLLELLLEWLDAHKGAFSANAFSHQHNIPSSRAEEGMELLLKSGAVEKVGGAMRHKRPLPSHLFEINKSRIRRVVSKAAGAIGGLMAKEG
jgi:hypothetical protein